MRTGRKVGAWCPQEERLEVLGRGQREGMAAPAKAQLAARASNVRPRKHVAEEREERAPRERAARWA